MSGLDVPAAAAAGTERILAHILPSTIVVFCAYFSIGMPLSVVPPYVHGTLGLGTIAVGAMIGLQPLASVLTRPWSGILSDTRGAKTAINLGLAACGLSGVFYLVSSMPVLPPLGSVAALVIGRLALGFGESLVMTGGLVAAIGLAGHKHSGKVMVWIGVALYGAIAAGAPLGAVLEHAFGFRGFALACAAVPWLGLFIGLSMPSAPRAAGPRIAFFKVVGLIWELGLGLALAVIGFGAIGSFIALDYAGHGWSGSSLALTGFGVGYIASRLLFGHLPDRLGGLPVAMVSLAVEIVGQAMIWRAPVPLVALAGCALTGFGFSLVFPSLGIEVVKRAPASSRGAVMGAYVAFFDIGLAIAGPGTGAVVAMLGYPSAYLIGTVAAASALVLVAGVKMGVAGARPAT
ncbi:MAG TPA: MFS transporter [Pseudolabrys sp.]|jgi:MFS family permease|nr:MFS transporter [Pseudolabrys sp.]